jgi:peptide/nickel transport system substrate-binding protein
MRKNLLVTLASFVCVGILLTSIPAAAAGSRVLRVTFSWPNVIDPAIGNDYASSSSIVNLYDTLVFPNAKGGVDPWLATSWNVSPDNVTYTFHLRSGVTFHDGSPLKASDVVFSYIRFKTIGRGFAYLVTPNIADVEAKDASTVVFKLANASALFLPSLVRLYIVEEALVNNVASDSRRRLGTIYGERVSPGAVLAHGQEYQVVG